MSHIRFLCFHTNKSIINKLLDKIKDLNGQRLSCASYGRTTKNNNKKLFAYLLITREEHQKVTFIRSGFEAGVRQDHQRPQNWWWPLKTVHDWAVTPHNKNTVRFIYVHIIIYKLCIIFFSAIWFFFSNLFSWTLAVYASRISALFQLGMCQQNFTPEK